MKWREKEEVMEDLWRLEWVRVKNGKGRGGEFERKWVEVGEV